MTTTTSQPSRLTEADALAMYTDCSIHELGRRAHEVTMRLHPEPWRTYVVDRNINYANWCTAKCLFCNFKADLINERNYPFDQFFICFRKFFWSIVDTVFKAHPNQSCA